MSRHVYVIYTIMIAYVSCSQVRLFLTTPQTDLINESYIIFVVSTTGNGELPVSARPLWRFLLRKGLPGDILSDLTFTTFGLGDSTYTRFCWASRMLHRRLQDLGAKEWLPSGEADEQHELGYVP